MYRLVSALDNQEAESQCNPVGLFAVNGTHEVHAFDPRPLHQLQQQVSEMAILSNALEFYAGGSGSSNEITKKEY